ncbi:hypothetical protein MIDIC_50070 [Alphaproteobacteria bacterium]
MRKPDLKLNSIYKVKAISKSENNIINILISIFALCLVGVCTSEVAAANLTDKSITQKYDENSARRSDEFIDALSPPTTQLPAAPISPQEEEESGATASFTPPLSLPQISLPQISQFTPSPAENEKNISTVSKEESHVFAEGDKNLKSLLKEDSNRAIRLSDIATVNSNATNDVKIQDTLKPELPQSQSDAQIPSSLLLMPPPTFNLSPTPHQSVGKEANINLPSVVLQNDIITNAVKTDKNTLDLEKRADAETAKIADNGKNQDVSQESKPQEVKLGNGEVNTTISKSSTQNKTIKPKIVQQNKKVQINGENTPFSAITAKKSSAVTKKEEKNSKENSLLQRSSVERSKYVVQEDLNTGKIPQITNKITPKKILPEFTLPEENEISQIDPQLQIRHRPVYDYRKNVLPPAINKKNYGGDNQHLPKVFYQKEYSTLLFGAIINDNLSAVKALLERGAEIDVWEVSTGYTPLMYAIHHNKLRIVRYLVMRGVNVNKTTLDGKTPLHIAAMNNNFCMLKVLLSANANIMAKDKYGYRPCYYITKIFNSIVTDIVSYYTDLNKALVDFVKLGSTIGTQYALDKGANINTISDIDDAMNTPLIMAVQNRDIKMVSILLLRGANLTIANHSKQTPVQIALQEGYNEVADILRTVQIKRELDALEATINRRHMN